MRYRFYLKAFTLLEVLMVLAIMSVLITIISSSLNRFNEQLHVSSSIQQELHDWYRFRSNLWREVIHADSMNLSSHTLKFYEGKNETAYRIMSDTLYRKTLHAAWSSTGFEVGGIRTYAHGSAVIYAIDFVWKEDLMTMHFTDHPTIKKSIDTYFERL